MRCKGNNVVFCCVAFVWVAGTFLGTAGRCGLKSALLWCAFWRLGLGGRRSHPNDRLKPLLQQGLGGGEAGEDFLFA